MFLVFDPETGQWEVWDVWNPRWMRDRTYRTKKRYSGAHPDEDAQIVVRATGNVRHTQNATRLWRGPANKLMAQWTGAEAQRIVEVLRAPERYPHKDRYRIWPGPNSNTYHRWVLNEAGVGFDPHPLAVGKDYLGPWGFGLGITPTFTGLQIETPLLGAKAGILDGIELHLLVLTIGVDFWPPAIKLPTGRYGFNE